MVQASNFDTICAAASVARSHGFAVVIFTPEELAGASVNRVQDRLVELGWEVISDLKPDENDAEPACDFCNDTQKIDGEACGWCTDVAYTSKPKRFAVVNLATDDQPTGFDTLEEARTHVAAVSLTDWEIWDGDTIVEHRDPDTDKVKR